MKLTKLEIHFMQIYRKDTATPVAASETTPPRTKLRLARIIKLQDTPVVDCANRQTLRATVRVWMSRILAALECPALVGLGQTARRHLAGSHDTSRLAVEEALSVLGSRRAR